MFLINKLRQLKHSVFAAPEPGPPIVCDSDFVLPKIRIGSLIDLKSASHVKILPAQITRPRDMVLPLADLLMVSAICQNRGPKKILEIGTFTGETTWTMAVNTNSDCEIFTLDLPLDQVPPIDSGGYITGEQFIGTPEASKITQLYGRSQEFDFEPYYGLMDLIFIDGDHTFKLVESDTQQALNLLRPGGLIIWDDYRYLPCHIGCRGVADYLHTMTDKLPLFQLDGTRLAVMETNSG